MLVPAYNEELTIKNCIDAMNGLNYRNHEVIIVNDGSKDDTLSELHELLVLESCHREPGGQLVYKPVKGFYQSARYAKLHFSHEGAPGEAEPAAV